MTYKQERFFVCWIVMGFLGLAPKSTRMKNIRQIMSEAVHKKDEELAQIAVNSAADWVKDSSFLSEIDGIHANNFHPNGKF